MGAHRETDSRFCNAFTSVTGQSTFFINNLKAAVEGDLDSHNNLGALISQTSGSFNINGKKLIVSMLDGSNPDVEGIVGHVTNLPTPKGGSSDFSAYVTKGLSGGGMGSIGGLLSVGENVMMGGNVIGVVNKMVNQGGGSGLLVLQNLQGSLPTGGSVVTGQSSGNSFTFSEFVTG